MNHDDQDDRRRRFRPWGNPGLREREHLRRVQFGQRGFLRPEIIGLLEQQPMSGVDLMNRLQDMSHGWYRPSPGSIYPLLEQLETEGLVAKNKEGKYELTKTYRDRSGIGDDLASAISSMESNTSYLEDLRRVNPANISKCSERIERLAKRLVALTGSVQTGSGSS